MLRSFEPQLGHNRVAVSWIVIGILAFALYAVLEPVNKRLAQLALVLRLGASFVGASSGSGLVVVMAATMFVIPERINELKLVGLPGFLAEVVTASWLLIKGLPRATAEARA